MDNNLIIKIAILDSIKWILLTSAIGFIQVIIHLFVVFIVNKVTFSPASVVESGALISFCLAIVSSIYFDAHFQKKHNTTALAEEFSDLFFKLFPWIIVLMVSLSTLLSLAFNESDVDKNSLIKIQVAAAIMSYIYSTYYKYISYLIGLKNDR